MAASTRKSTLSICLHSALALALFAASSTVDVRAAAALPALGVDPDGISVSGLSSGGYLAVQLGMAYSASIRGIGVIAGGPYLCAQGSVARATTVCSCTGIWFFSSCRVRAGGTDVAALIRLTERNAADGVIDATSGVRRQRLWLFSGTGDSVVPQPVMDDLHAYYRHYGTPKNIAYVRDVAAQHAMPTSTFGEACNYLGSPYINRCGFDAAGELLQWIYGANLKRPASAEADATVPPERTSSRSTTAGTLVEFDQRQFFADGAPLQHGMATTGLVYVPAACGTTASQPRSGACRLHVALHGCQQEADRIGQSFAEHAGYNRWADANRIVVLYPQAAAIAWVNPKACWNWFGYDAADRAYATRNGLQMAAIKRMMDRLVQQ